VEVQEEVEVHVDHQELEELEIHPQYPLHKVILEEHLMLPEEQVEEVELLQLEVMELHLGQVLEDQEEQVQQIVLRVHQ
jgi:hypothetical protein